MWHDKLKLCFRIKCVHELNILKVCIQFGRVIVQTKSKMLFSEIKSIHVYKNSDIHVIYHDFLTFCVCIYIILFKYKIKTDIKSIFYKKYSV